MKKLICSLFFCTAILTACSFKTQDETTTTGTKAMAYETNIDLSNNVQDQLQTSSIIAGNYYLQDSSDSSTTYVPCLTLFDNGTFGFTYDVLSSYYPNGTYEIKDNEIIMNTDDGKYHYTFLREENGDLVFQAGESSDVTPIQRDFGAPITEGSVFSIMPPKETSKSISLDSPPQCLLVSNIAGNENPIPLASGGYTWNYERNGQTTNTVACGLHPLDPLIRKSTKPVKPGSYTLSYSEVPDSVLVKVWDDAKAVEQEKMEEAEYNEITLAPDRADLNLEKNQVYEITLTYDKSISRPFGGVVYYVLVTE